MNSVVSPFPVTVSVPRSAPLSMIGYVSDINSTSSKSMGEVL